MGCPIFAFHLVWNQGWDNTDCWIKYVVLFSILYSACGRFWREYNSIFRATEFIIGPEWYTSIV